MIAVYLRDQNELDRAADIFHGWLGNRRIYAGFSYDERFPAPVPSRHGKNVGFTDWTHRGGVEMSPAAPMLLP